MVSWIIILNPCTRIYFGGVMTKKNKNNSNKVVVIVQHPTFVRRQVQHPTFVRRQAFWTLLIAVFYFNIQWHTFHLTKETVK